ncbi:MAG TPA: PEPxxWA-CTERM sorting domain-containing protein [Caulobacteraceae bacterium]|nr:PEPxxWA-CTERM sorting domain-containing protein [Caulobacteraceae bacterium]
MMAGSAGAATFGPATGAIAVLASPVVTLGATSGTGVFNSLVAIFGTTGSLTSASGSGSVLGTLDFSNTVGTVVPDVVSGFMSFADTSGGSFLFDVASVKTLSYASTVNSTSISLYLLGAASDAKLGLTSAPASETLTFNRTGASEFSASATIAAPPSLTSGVPEPATWTMLLMGFGWAGAAVRLRARKRTALA